MRMRQTLRKVGQVAALLFLGSLCSCRSIQPIPPDNAATNPKVKFLITFDDGPSGRSDKNPTLAILDQLAINDVQTNLCAIFFIQTHHPRGTAIPKGMEVLQEISRRGQLVGIHSVSPRGHVDHTTIPTNELVTLLVDGKQLLKKISGEEPIFVRPPYGVSNPTTCAIYHELNLNMLMADIPAHDGVIYGLNGSPRRRSNMRNRLTSMRNKLVKRPAGIDPYPVIISFHDVNPYTARHMAEYLHIIVEEAANAGLSLYDKPFYDSPRESTAAALYRIIPPP
jgi:peptidoglycan/xylan/chitin deacetylase (PgdA/CDA1 family)